MTKSEPIFKKTERLFGRPTGRGGGVGRPPSLPKSLPFSCHASRGAPLYLDLYSTFEILADFYFGGKFFQDIINKGDVIFVIGSQVVRMEKVVKEIMAEPLRAGELLCRQGRE